MDELNLDHTDFAALSSQILNRGSAFTFKAQGQSMRPFILDGDTLVVEPAVHSSLLCGDILFCRVDHNRIVVHRLVKRLGSERTGKYMIRGDACHNAPEVLTAEQVLGRVTLVRRRDNEIDQHAIVNRMLVCLWMKTFPVSSILYYLPSRLLRKCNRLLHGSGTR